jgi:hypothetical protein
MTLRAAALRDDRLELEAELLAAVCSSGAAARLGEVEAAREAVHLALDLLHAEGAGR